MIKRIAYALIMVIGSQPLQGAADKTHSLGTFGAWKAYTYAEAKGGDKNQKVCFMSAAPLKSEGVYTKRGEVHFLVTHRPDATGEVSFVAGYPFGEGATVTLTVDKDKTYTLLTQGEGAWLTSADDDQKVGKILQSANTLTVQGSSARGTQTTDTFSLKGFAKAYQTISKECGRTAVARDNTAKKVVEGKNKKKTASSTKGKKKSVKG